MGLYHCDRFDEAYAAFVAALPAGATVVVHLAGHGFEGDDGELYFVPVDGTGDGESGPVGPGSTTT